MVYVSMGLLDEAIHEHFELKRLRGANPSQVARQEREVFGAVGKRDQADGEYTGVGVSTTIAVADLVDGDWAEREFGVPAPPANDFTNNGGLSSSVLQETLELDMTAVLYEQAEATEASNDAGPVASAPVEPFAVASLTGGPRPIESAERRSAWKMPSERPAGDLGAPPDIPGQERFGFE